MKVRIVSILLTFGILTILGLVDIFSFLKPLAQVQSWLFGYLGYIWLFIAAFFIYKTKLSLDFKSNRFLEKALGIVIGVFALLVLQGLFFKQAGILGIAFNSVLSPLITHLGIFILVLLSFAFSIILYSGKSPKELVKIFLKDLKEDWKQSQVPKEKIIKDKEKLKRFGLQIKAFFTPPSQVQKKSSQDTTNKESPQKKEAQNVRKNETQESNASTFSFAKTPNAPRALTLEELIEQSKNNPPPTQFSFKDDKEEELEEAEDLRDEKEERFDDKQPFESEIDALRQDVELPTREDNPLENVSIEQNVPQIRIVSPQEAKQGGENFDATQFQLKSMANLETFKHFEQNPLYQKQESKEEVIKLIKKEECKNAHIAYPQSPEMTLRDSIAESQNVSSTQDSPISQDSTLVESAKPKPIKAYPKNLYAATPFSAYYDKEPVGTHDCLVQEHSINRDNLQDSSCAKDNAPSTIFYYGNIKSTRPIQAQEIQQISQEIAQNNPKEESNVNEPATINQIVKQVIQEFMESQAVQKQIPNESWEECNQKNVEDEKPQAQNFKEAESDSTQTAEKTESAVRLENPQKIDEVVTEIPTTQTPLNYTPPPFATNKIPSYGYNFDDNLKKEVNKAQMDLPLSKAIPPKNSLDAQSPNTETISLFKEVKASAVAHSTQSPSKEGDSLPQTAVESCVPFIKQENKEASHTAKLKQEETKQLSIPNDKAMESQIPHATQENIALSLDSKERNTLVKSIPENESLLNALEIDKDSQNLESQDFILPKLGFLQAPQEERVEIDEGEIDRKINDLLGKLRMFKIEGDIVRTYSGPIVTTFEFRPSPNVKVSRILTLQDDLAMALRAKTIRIQAPVPGKDVVGIEIPNNQIETIYLREILEHSLFLNSASPLTLALGKDIVGNPFVTDLKKLPHLLIAGTTGSGKSVGINAMILSLLYKNSPDQLKLLMIDPKMLEFSIYNEIPHLLTPVITQPKKAIIALDNTVKEMERRYALMSEARIKNIEGYNQKAEIEGFEPFPYIVVIIDELADLMMSGGKEAEVSISRLAQMARASGIHLIVATQRPSVDVVTGLIKANLPSRISYKVGQKIDSKVILDSFGAESLLGRGDMLFTPPGGGIVRLHAPWSTETEIEKIVEFIKAQRPPQYDENFMPSEDEVLGLRVEGETDELYEEAKRIILSDGKTSISYIQRRLGIGYNKAANIIEQMQVRGFLSEPNSKGVREILGN